MHTFEQPTQPTFVVTGGGGAAPKIAQGIAETIPEARIVLVEGTHDGGSTNEEKGGATGKLRRWYGIPAVGDIRQGLAHLGGVIEGEIANERLAGSASLETVRELGDRMFETVKANSPDIDESWLALQLDRADEMAADIVDRGKSLKGHTYGNFLLAAHVRSSENIADTAKQIGRLMGLPHNRLVLPVSLDNHDLVLRDYDENGNEIVIVGEGDIDERTVLDINRARVELTNNAAVYDEVAAEITNASALVISSGSYYTTVTPIFKAKGMPEAIANMDEAAPIIAIPNATRDKVLPNWTLRTMIDNLETYTNPDGKSGRGIDQVIIHEFKDTSNLPDDIEPAILNPSELGIDGDRRIPIVGEFVSDEIAEYSPESTCERSKLHHDGRAIGLTLREMLGYPLPDTLVLAA